MKKMRLERFIFQGGYKSFLLHLFNLNATRDLKGIRELEITPKIRRINKIAFNNLDNFNDCITSNA